MVLPPSKTALPSHSLSHTHSLNFSLLFYRARRDSTVSATWDSLFTTNEFLVAALSTPIWNDRLILDNKVFNFLLNAA